MCLPRLPFVFLTQVGHLLSDLRRVNVAITRAKRKLVLVGSASTLSKPPSAVSALVDVVSSRGWVRCRKAGALGGSAVGCGDTTGARC